jgi:hypothetical protein
MNQKPTKKAILLDADVLIHFSKGDSVFCLKKIYPNHEKWLLDAVKTEIRFGKARSETEFAILEGFIKLISFPATNTEVYLEYAKIKRDKITIGEGEAHCLAYLRHNNHVLASSNLKDIQKYCEEHQIVYLTTMDLLCEALSSGEMSEEDCDNFIEKVLAQNSKLPVQFISQYKEIRRL